MLKFRFLPLALAGAPFVSVSHASGFADVVIGYNSGTGFSSGFTNPAVALGSPTSSATPFAPAFQKTQLLSIGAGGSVTLGFNTPILNDPSHPYGLDFSIFGNSFFIESGVTATGSLFGSAPGSTQVSVSQDGVNFYTLNPSLAPTVNLAFPTDGPGDPTMPVNPALTPADFTGQTLAGIRSLYSGSAGGSSYSISWAEDSNSNSIYLPSVSYVRVDVLTGKAQVDAISEVPEPSTNTLLSLGALTLTLIYRRNKTLKPFELHT